MIFNFRMVSFGRNQPYKRLGDLITTKTTDPFVLADRMGRCKDTTLF